MKIGTRGSGLALVQAKWVAQRLKTTLGKDAEIVVIKTQGDRVWDRPLRELEGRGYFTREIEEALLRGSVDLAVHSFKDLPSSCPEGLDVVAVTPREDPADLLVIAPSAVSMRAPGLPIRNQAVVGTSAVRRQTQLQAIRADLSLKDLRGNVPTRARKLREGGYDAIFLASAAKERLEMDLSGLHLVRLEPERFVPSPGQGALAVQMRTGDPEAQGVRESLHDATSAEATRIERKVQAFFGGGCGLPLGAHACCVDGTWRAYGFWGGGPGETPRWGQASGTNPDVVVEALLRSLSREPSSEASK